MSRGTATPPTRPDGPPRPPASQFETLIENRLDETRRQVKGVDVVAGILILGIGTLAYLLLAVVIDHWVAPGGLGFWGRFLLLAGLLGGAGYYFVRVILPPLMSRVNPIFAAHTIERSQPSLKNSLINFLLLRGQRQAVAPVVYQAMEHRAAVDLSQVEIEAAVERKHVFRLAYVLAAVVAVSGFYLALWPQKTAASAARVILPWAGIDAPTRVTIKDVDPGDMLADRAAYRGDFVTVSARVEGLHENEQVVLHYSTADEQTNEAITMKLMDGYRHECQLPPGELRLQQDVRYRLSAGDCTTPWYKIEVQTAPAILVDALEYEYPPYTGTPDWTDEESRDIRAIEGTVVTIRATANRAIQRAAVDMNCDGQLDLEMTVVDGDRATRRLPLQLDPADLSRPEYESYRLRFTDRNGRWNPRPIRHWIEVIPDLPPEVEILHPEETDIELAEDQPLEIHVRAEDPDFALRRVVLHAEEDGEALDIAPLLDGQFEGEFQKEYVFQPSDFGLTGGDVVNYWAEAEDNKTPQPGVARTTQYRIRIVSPQRAESPRSPSDAAQQSPSSFPEENPPQDAPPQEPTDDGQPPPEEKPREPEKGTPPEQSQSGTEGQDKGEDSSKPDQTEQQKEGKGSADGQSGSKSGSDGKGEGEPSEESSEPIDPEAEPGDAMREILEHIEEQEKNGTQSDQPKPGEQEPGEQTSGEQKPGEQTSGEQKPGEQTSGEQKPGKQTSGEQKPGEQTSGEQKPGEQTSGEQKPGEQTSGEQKPGEQTSGEQKPGEQTSGEQKPGEQTSGEQKPGEQTSGEQKPGEQTSGEEKPGKGEPSKDKSGSTTPQAGNQPREKKPGEGAEDQPKPGQDSPDSPGISPKGSDSESRTEGDRAGGGGKGGAQPANQDGTGSPGSNTDADEGASRSDQPGEGETGSRGGDGAETDQETGSSATKPEGEEAGRQPAQPGSEGAADDPNRPDDSPPGEPMQDPPDGGQPGDRTSEGPGAMGDGAPITGGGPNQRPPGKASPQDTEPGGDDPNLEYARKQSELVLEYLKNLSDQQRSELLDRLRWTEKQERTFRDKLAQWNHDAQQRGPRGDAAREALLSFGLRPGGTELRSDQMNPDRLEKLREGLRSPAPGGWSEWLRAYNRGIAGGGR